MLEARIEVQRSEFDAITRRLVARAEGGRGRVRRIPSADAEDVVQEAWEKTVKQSRVPPGDELEAHVHEALVDTSADYRRRTRRKKEIPVELREALDGGGDDHLITVEIEETSLGVARARQIRRGLRDNTDAQVERYAILEALDFTEKEIAQQLGIDAREAGRIRKRFARARPALRRALGHKTERLKEET